MPRQGQTYLAVKNLIHNELEVSRQDILEVVREAVQETVDAQVKRLYNEESFEDKIEREFQIALQSLIQGHFTRWTMKQTVIDAVAEFLSDNITVDLNVKPSTSNTNRDTRP